MFADGRLSIVMTIILPKLIYIFSATAIIKIPADFVSLFCRNWQADFKIHRKMKRSQSSQNNLERKEQSWKNRTFWFQLQRYGSQDCGTDIVIHIDQQNKTGSAEINFHIYGPLIFDKGDKTIQRRKDSLFKKWC